MTRIPTIKFCPITGNQPLTCTEKGFIESCRHFRGLFARRAERRFEYCAICQGEIPANVTFIQISAQQQEIIMSKQKRIEGKCESCLAEKNTVLHYGKQVCSVCMAMRGVARNNPDAVIAALKEFGTLPSMVGSQPVDPMLSAENEKLKKSLEETKQDLSDLRQRNVNFFNRLATAMDRATENIDGLDEMEACVATMTRENQFLREQLEEATAELDAMTLVPKSADPPPTDTARAGILLDIVMDTLSGSITGLDVERLRGLR